MTKLQCQSCVNWSSAPNTVGSERIPWTCPFCKARHRIVMSMGSLKNMEMIDVVNTGDVAWASSAVRADLEEAARAINAGAPRAGAVMMRRALERRMVELGQTDGSLAQKIRRLGEAGIIDEVTSGAAQAIRFFGNYGAHPDDDLVDGVDTQRAIRAFHLVLDVVRETRHP